MNVNTLELFISKAKLLKCNYVSLIDHFIFGTDDHLAHLSVIPYTEPELAEFKRIVFETKKFTIVNNVDFDPLIDNVNKILQTPPILSIQDLEQDEVFRDILAKKTDQGLSWFRVKGYLMSLNKSLVPLNKADKLQLNIRDFGNLFNGEFIITKPKNIVIKKYFSYIKV